MKANAMKRRAPQPLAMLPLGEQSVEQACSAFQSMPLIVKRNVADVVIHTMQCLNHLYRHKTEPENLRVFQNEMRKLVAFTESISYPIPAEVCEKLIGLAFSS